MLDALANNPLLQLLLLAAAIAAAVWVSNQRERRQRATRRIIPRALSPSANVPPPTGDAAWLAQLGQALHLLVIGHSQGGKTTLIHELACRLATAKIQVIVCDPDAAPGLWPGCAVYGYANDFADIERALASVQAEVEQRRALRGTGRQRTFAPLYLVIDEYQDIGRAGGCPEARPLVEDVLRRGGKLNVHLIIGVQDKQVKTMGFEGHGDLRRNFTSIVEVRADRGGHRWATVSTPTDEAATATYPVPPLPDLERLIAAAPQPLRAPPINPLSSTVTAGTSRELPATTAGISQEIPENDAENLQDLEMRFLASARDFILSEAPFSIEEIAQMAAMIARGGKGKTEIVQAMPGYSGRKHKAYAACYDRVREAVEMHSSSSGSS
jgi:hypothetical protein